MNRKTIICLAALAVALWTASAQNTPAADSEQQCDQNLQMVALVLTVMGLLSVLYSYQLTQTKNGLESQVKHNKEIILKQRAEINSNEATLQKQHGELSEDQKRMLDEEMAKSKDKTGPLRPQRDKLRKEYWDRIGKLSESKIEPPGKIEMDELLAKKSEIEGMIQLTKTKYYQRVIDEASFNEITKEYQKQLIEVESKIAKLNKGGETNG